MFDRLLIANRGEIAVRIARTCRELGVETVAVYSDVDARARHVAMADASVHLPGVAPSETYLNADALIAAALHRGAEAIHPGYGFLSESALFAEEVAGAGLVWVGPPPDAMRKVGDKISARKLAEGAGVPILPGLSEAVEDPDEVARFAGEHGYPIAIKASSGGGGRGLKVVREPGEISRALESARREAESYFGRAEVFVERYLDSPKHVEVQILSPSENESLWLGARDCSLQRRHQKLIEETPPPLGKGLVAPMGESAVALAKACGYVNAGTVEFLVEGAAGDGGRFYFLEVNARLQVEHTVTEEVYGLDLVACQLRIAAGDPVGFSQGDLDPRGASIECRINAEDPASNFAPRPGVLTRFEAPAGPGIRLDSGYGEGDEIAGAYDSLIAKLVTSGPDREAARRRMLRALDELVIEGVPTTVAAHRLLLESPDFVAGSHSTTTVESGVLAELERGTAEGEPEIPPESVLLVGGEAATLWNPAMSAAAAAGVGSSGRGDVVAPMQGTILQVLVEEGASVAPGDALIVLEAMKMETTIAASRSGTVARILVGPGDRAGAGQLVAVIE